jgi:hypothetical protein
MEAGRIQVRRAVMLKDVLFEQRMVSYQGKGVMTPGLFSAFVILRIGAEAFRVESQKL